MSTRWSGAPGRDTANRSAWRPSSRTALAPNTPNCATTKTSGADAASTSPRSCSPTSHCPAPCGSAWGGCSGPSISARPEGSPCPAAPRAQTAQPPCCDGYVNTDTEGAAVKIRFGVGLGADTGPDQLADIVDHLETSGVDSLWFSELVYTPAVDPMVGMAYALARTTRLKVGTSVVVLPGRHPVLVAKQLASLAALAPKRVLPVFGLRLAIPAEREVFVVPDGERAAVFDESLQLLRLALADDSASYAGRYFTVSNAAVTPRPSPPLDIWLGGSAPAA